jgi:hypothetical protein
VPSDLEPAAAHAYIAARSSLPSLNSASPKLPAELADVGLLKQQLSGALLASFCEIFATLGKFFRPVTLQSGFPAPV